MKRYPDMDNIEDFYPLSPLQEGMLFHTLYAPGTGIYVNHLSCALSGRLDVSAFERAWQRVVQQHAALRTFFIWKNVKSPVQAVRRCVELPFEQQDWRGLAAAEQEARFERFKQADRAGGFELSKPPLMRLALMQLGADNYQFVWSYHHLLLDGWSIPLIFKDLLICYRAFSKGQEAHLTSSRPFREYLMWLRQRDMSKAEAFWRQTLKGFNALTPLPLDRLGGELPEGAKTHDKQQLRLSAELSASLQLFARQHQLTLNTLLQAAWALLLSRYSGEEEVVYGAVVSGRPSELHGVETMVGAFINTLPMRVHVASDAPLLPWLKELQQQQLAMIEYEYSPLQQVQGWSDLPRGVPLFESGFAFENYPMDATANEGAVPPPSRQELKVSNMRTAQQANFPLNVLAMPGQRIGIHILHDCSRYEAATVERLLDNLGNILEGIVSRPVQRLSSISLLNQAQRRQTLTEWNQTLDASVARRCLHELFEEQARKRPEAVALVLEGERLSYGELNARANRLARYLRRRGVGAEVRVGILLERSLEMVIGILGVLKAGGAYVPLDPEYPAQRLSMMMEDAEVWLLLTQEKLKARVEASSAEMLCLDADWKQSAEESAENLEDGAEANNLAYIIFTSGSTGRPKGVLVAHSGLNNLAQTQIRAFDVRPESRVFQFASLSFDASVWEIVMTLATGATLYLGSKEHLFGQPLADLLRRHSITHITIPPSVLAALPSTELPALKTIVVAGEAC
ncbi:MAG: AMP-binding protein, partial [Acidobacteria bacterium]|nr:AMP-binding protein [Acidobacteriota bacterium]